jgi:hypothetical protein
MNSLTRAAFSSGLSKNAPAMSRRRKWAFSGSTPVTLPFTDLPLNSNQH